MLKVNPGLKAAVDTLKGINKQVKKTTECTLADVIAYADAEAIEASGGPRIQVRKLWRSMGVQANISEVFYSDHEMFGRIRGGGRATWFGTDSHTLRGESKANNAGLLLGGSDSRCTLGATTA